MGIRSGPGSWRVIGSRENRLSGKRDMAHDISRRGKREAMTASVRARLKEKLDHSSDAVDMTVGPVRKTIAAFAVPIMIGNLFQQMYSMVDTAVVGRGVGSDALAAVGTTSPVVQLLLGLMIGMTSGMSVVIAQYFGAGETHKVRKAIANGIVLISVLTVLITVVGIAGVAVATVLSELISALLCILYMKKAVPYVRFRSQDWKFDRKIWLEHLHTGIPMAFFSSLLAVSVLVLQAALNSLGRNDMAAYTAASKMDTLVYQILGAFGTAISTFAAQNYGKGELERVREGVRKSLSMAVLISMALTVIVFLSGHLFMQLFVDGRETEILETGIMYMRITSVFYIILGVNFIVRFALTGVGKTVIPMMVGISEILTRAAVTYFLVYRIGFLGMISASPACWFTSTLLCVVCYKPMMHSAFEKFDARQL